MRPVPPERYEIDPGALVRAERLVRGDARSRQLRAVAALGLHALETPNAAGVMHHAVRVVAEVLDVELVGILELSADGQRYRLRAGAGWSDGLVGSAQLDADPSQMPAVTLAAPEPIRVEDQWEETRFEAPPLLEDHGARSGIGVAIRAPGPRDRLFGVLGAHSREVRRFTRNEAYFLEAVANIVAGAILRASADAELVDAERRAQEERARAVRDEEGLAARDEFLSVAAHELRTPVAALHLQLEALRDLLGAHGQGLDSRVREKVERAARTVARLTDLVEGVLDVSRVALGTLELRLESVDLAETVREVIAHHDGLARRAGCELRLEAPASLPGRWDRTRLEQVITNLLSNALKFGAGQPVDVRLEHAGGEARLTVRDRGDGVDPAHAKRIMRRFERAVSQRSYGGLGLGLYIASRIAQGHGGGIAVASVPGRGATFTVTLPCPADPG